MGVMAACFQSDPAVGRLMFFTVDHLLTPRDERIKCQEFYATPNKHKHTV